MLSLATASFCSFRWKGGGRLPHNESMQPTQFFPLSGLVDAPPGPPPLAFHIMVKPRGAICNLDCSYCFYLRKEQLFDGSRGFRMPDDVLESFTRQYIEAQCVPQVTFAWQGGEPTLMGLDFFRRAVELQKKYAPPQMQVSNSFQTNGLLVDDEWCEFFRENGFLIGLSMDGPPELHDLYRVDKGGHATSDRVLGAMRRMKAHGVDFNILCVVNRSNAKRPLDVYRFYRDEGVEFVQFIPAVEHLGEGRVTDWSVRADDWGGFLCAVFDEWVRRDVGRIFVQSFDVALEAFAGMEPSLCVHAKTCGNALAIEHDGKLFSCDHYVCPENYLGDIGENAMQGLVASGFQRKFGQDKWDRLTQYCRSCPVLFACNGGCPKDRFVSSPDGEPGLHYLCSGYKRFFTHIAPYMRRMAELLEMQRAPAEIMGELEAASRSAASGGIGRNSPCPCGSGRKYKQCCMR